jgi:hypothetical protein
MLAHGAGLMCPETQIRTGPSSAEQCEASLFVLRIEGDRVPLIYAAATFPQSGTGKAPALMAERRKLDAESQGGVPYMFIAARGDCALAAVGSDQSYMVSGWFGHVPRFASRFALRRGNRRNAKRATRNACQLPM